jgi:hypothetical protein
MRVINQEWKRAYAHLQYERSSADQEATWCLIAATGQIPGLGEKIVLSEVPSQDDRKSIEVRILTPHSGPDKLHCVATLFLDEPPSTYGTGYLSDSKDILLVEFDETRTDFGILSLENEFELGDISFA